MLQLRVNQQTLSSVALHSPFCPAVRVSQRTSPPHQAPAPGCPQEEICYQSFTSAWVSLFFFFSEIHSLKFLWGMKESPRLPMTEMEAIVADRGNNFIQESLYITLQVIPDM